MFDEVKTEGRLRYVTWKNTQTKAFYSLDIHHSAKFIIEILENAGYQAYVVGGCVRDALLGKEPHDWDICTSAKPEEVCSLMRKQCLKVIETGLQHGTVTVLTDNWSFEVTTFRVDGEYSDNRRPDHVEFVEDLVKDLSRRDFTINAMAYNDSTGLTDICDTGWDDLNNKLIRCVGHPDDRFREDALRILRALRFASTYQFKIEEKTAAAIHRNKDLLNNISAERIRDELCKMLLGRGVLDILLEYSDVMAVIIPELEPCIGFEQNNPYHMYTVYEHTARAVKNYLADDISIKMALLLHDIGKPECYSEDEAGIGHFHGHGVVSKRIAEEVMRRLRFDNKTAEEVATLVLYHDADIRPTPAAIRRWLSKIDYEMLQKLLIVRLVDISAQRTTGNKNTDPRIADVYAVQHTMQQVLWDNACFKIKDLAVNGNDIMRICGIESGPIVGKVLKHLLDKVIDGEIENDANDLILEAKRYLEEK